MSREGRAQQPAQEKARRAHNAVEPPPYPAAKARGADIVLRKGWERWVFIGGLVAIVVLLLVLRAFAG